MKMSSMHFLVIGSAKSATTSLFRYLETHPSISMPAEKEIGFFSDDARYAKGVDWYTSQWPERLRPGTLRGEASPQYMQTPVSANRIAKHFPNARLIALLRNPIDRAYAHYRHARRNQVEQRDFTTLARAWSAGAPLPGSSPYFRGSLYGESLGPYGQLFEREQIRIVFTEALSGEPLDTVQSIYAWLGVDSAYQPACIDRKFNGGQIAPHHQVVRTARAGYASLRARLGLRSPLEQLLPGRFGKLYRDLRLRVETTSSRASSEAAPEEARTLLASAFSNDVALLQQTFGVTVPWEDFGGCSLREAI